MATKLVPMGEGMYQYAGGAWGYLEPLPGTTVDITSCDDDGDKESPIPAGKYEVKKP